MSAITFTPAAVQPLMLDGESSRTYDAAPAMSAANVEGQPPASTPTHIGEVRIEPWGDSSVLGASSSGASSFFSAGGGGGLPGKEIATSVAQALPATAVRRP